MRLNMKVEVFAAGDSPLSVILRIIMRRMEMSIGWQGRGSEVPHGFLNVTRHRTSVQKLQDLLRVTL